MDIRSIRAGFNVLLLATLLTPAVWSHPLGNFSVNQYSFFHFERDRIVLNYYIDFAEIPTFTELTYLDPNGDQVITDAERLHYLDTRQKELLEKLFMDISDVPVRFVLTRRSLVVPDPTSPTLIVSASLEVDLSSVRVGPTNQAHYIDQNFPDKTGWKQIAVTTGPGVVITKDSIRERLSHINLFNVPAIEYMTDREVYWEFTLDSPPLYNEGWVAPATPVVTMLAGETIYQPTSLDPTTGEPVAATVLQSRPARPEMGRPSASSDKLIELMKNPHRGGWFFAIALGLSFIFGAWHALEPGHGKTVVAAYLIGERGTIRDAAMLGVIVTITHTGSVFLMWAGIYFLREIFSEAIVFKWIEILSGFIILILGIWLIFYRWYNPLGRPAHVHGHGHEHGPRHSHGGLTHTHGPGGHTHEIPAGVSYRQLLVLGITGGIIPCPGAIVVLLIAMSQGLFLFGFSLILSFSVGLALVLMTIGILMVTAKSFLDKHHVGEGFFSQRILPVFSAVLITILGVFLTLSPLLRYGYVQINL
ncbi:hypothetical protein HS125_20165 [bacterium]|nr:hypothetical protein [bacterium]